MAWTYSSTVSVNPCAINSSGTSSGRNTAGVTQGQRVLVGSSVTITSPLAKPSRTRPVESSIVRIDWIGWTTLTVVCFGMSITAGWDVLLVSGGGRLWPGEAVASGAGWEEITCLGLVGRRASIVTWTDSVGRTAAGVISLGGAGAALSVCAFLPSSSSNFTQLVVFGPSLSVVDPLWDSEVSWMVAVVALFCCWSPLDTATLRSISSVPELITQLRYN
uniref:(northern house mosquito) hypothetical protein n=1 Tax=Culex pipiens TaxID=7175 RepID=A0A8D8MU94_CULPI